MDSLSKYQFIGISSPILSSRITLIPDSLQAKIAELLKKHNNGAYPTLKVYHNIKKHFDSYTKNKTKIIGINNWIIGMNNNATEINFDTDTKDQYDLRENLCDLHKQLEPLTKLSPWNKESVHIISQLCHHLYHNVTTLISVDKIDQWFANYSVGKMPEWLVPFIDKWNVINKGSSNALLIKTLLTDMCRYKNFVIYNYVKELILLGEIVNQDILSLSDYLKESDSDRLYDDFVMEHGFDKLLDTIPEYHFEAIYDNYICRIMKIVNQVIQENPDYVQWIIDDNCGSSFSKHKVLEQIKNHPFIKTKLSAMELEWSLDNLKTIYTKGWNFWIIHSLVQKGIGIRKLNFDHGVALVNEETCIYWLKKWISEWHHKRQRFEGVYNFSDNQSLWSDTRKFLIHMDLTKLDGK